MSLHTLFGPLVGVGDLTGGLAVDVGLLEVVEGEPEPEPEPEPDDGGADPSTKLAIAGPGKVYSDLALYTFGS